MTASMIATTERTRRNKCSLLVNPFIFPPNRFLTPNIMTVQTLAISR